MAHPVEIGQNERLSRQDVSIPLQHIVPILLTITWTIVAFRFYTRGWITPCLKWDDFTILIATVFYTIFAAAAITDTNIVLKPNFMLNPKLISAGSDWLIVSEVFYILTMIVFKISVGLFFLRITSTAWHRITVYGIVAFTTLYGIAYFFFTIFQCGVPKTGLVFATNRLHGRCVSNRTILGLSFAHAAVGSLTDLAFALFPIILVRKSQLTPQAKATVGFIVFLGGIGSICSLVRFKFIHQLTSNRIHFPDLALWSLLEAGIGIVANSLATLRPFLKLIFRDATTAASVDGSRALLPAATAKSSSMYQRSRRADERDWYYQSPQGAARTMVQFNMANGGGAPLPVEPLRIVKQQQQQQQQPPPPALPPQYTFTTK